MAHYLSPSFIIEHLNRFVVGQDRAKKDLALLGFYQVMRSIMDVDAYEKLIAEKHEQQYGTPDKSFSDGMSLVSVTKADGSVVDYSLVSASDDTMDKVRRRNTFESYLDDSEPALPTQNVLILGPSGCGKTYLIKLLGKVLEVPVIYVNAKDLTNTGFVGQTIADLVQSGLDDATASGLYTPIQMRYSIIFIDEFDKICAPKDSAGSWDKGLQSSLLCALEGNPIRDSSNRRTVCIDTSRFMFVLGGAFQSMRDAKKAKINSIGYGTKVSDESRDVFHYSHTDLENAGVLREIAGRIPVVTEVLALTKEELKAALSAENSLIEPYEKLFKFLERDFHFHDEKIDEIVETCLKAKTGARGLRTGLHEVYKDELFDLQIWIEDSEEKV